ncbi:MAG: GH3 auxin-responsive promoter, partial [Pseudomonadota bacterium]|nr:GH3 auxin-responsive promoter [Pseudomonadota bacterium]
MSALQNLTTSLLHFASATLTRKGAKKFIDASHDIESVQRDILKDTLAMVMGAESAKKHGLDANMSLEDFRNQVPI